MNWNEREAIRDRLMENLARHMISHGIIKSDRERANPRLGTTETRNHIE